VFSVERNRRQPVDGLEASVRFRSWGRRSSSRFRNLRRRQRVHHRKDRPARQSVGSILLSKGKTDCMYCFVLNVFFDRKKCKFLTSVTYFTKWSNAPIDWFCQPERKDWTNNRMGSNGWPSIRNLDLCRIGKGFSKIGSS